VNSFTLTKGAGDLSYPPNKYSDSNYYGIQINVGVNTWNYRNYYTRANTLSPITTSSLFNAYSDQYGSSKSSY